MALRVKIHQTVITDGRTGRKLKKNWTISLVDRCRVIATDVVKFVIWKRVTVNNVANLPVAPIVNYARKGIMDIRIPDANHARVLRLIEILHVAVMLTKAK